MHNSSVMMLMPLCWRAAAMIHICQEQQVQESLAFSPGARVTGDFEEVPRLEGVRIQVHLALRL